ncbi:hypothetical protein C8N43_1744 [Litoreibacter ponti]|uniref:Uncharacterized protein n=1 Tax=Litoreibacter ponti TaxID=1510457 RepID=A0A2T6BLX8_9RHOB|nr:hypothetical protein [Litoreibacter ponti]PTX57078.1 hypothetical protein C8N43_1744 [Litoreibacter ponti]
MSVVLSIFKHLQLFCFAFALAASGMLYVGISSGQMERGPIYLGLAEQFASVMAATPAFQATMDGYPAAQAGEVHPAQLPAPSIGVVQSASESLRGLRTRQFAGLGQP